MEKSKDTLSLTQATDASSSTQRELTHVERVDAYFAANRDTIFRSLCGKGLAPSEADDLTHEVYQRVRQRSLQEPVESLRKYVTRCLTTTFLQFRRKEQRESQLVVFDSEAAEVKASELPVLNPIAEDVSVGELMSYLGTLTEKQQVMLILNCVDGLPASRIASALGLKTHDVQRELKPMLDELYASLDCSRNVRRRK